MQQASALLGLLTTSSSPLLFLRTAMTFAFEKLEVYQKSVTSPIALARPPNRFHVAMASSPIS
jgi:hypothetical protein